MTPVVFLHGFLGSPDEWNPMIESLDRPDSCLAASLPIATDWRTGVDRLTVQLPARFILVGYSMGARIALAIALNNPRRVCGLCLIAGHPGLESQERRARRLRDEAVARRLLDGPVSDFLYFWYRQPVFASISDATRDEWIRQKQSLDRPYHANLLRCYTLGRQPNYWPRLAELNVPTLIVVGEQDDKYVSVAHTMQRAAPQLKLSFVPSSGHAVHREQPTVLREILQKFWASLTEEEHRHE
jgi:2-succinyl-6-hydroxy-2,4-cyclohexadiene-1-carboxylate synthase